MSREKQLVRLPEAIMWTQARIDVVRVICSLAIIDGSFLNLVDCGINLANRSVVVVFNR